MKQALLISLAVAFLMGCGAGHSDLTSITVSPQSATATSSPPGSSGLHCDGKLPKRKEPGTVASGWSFVEDLANSHRKRRCYYRFDWGGYLFCPRHCHHHCQRSSKPAVHG